MKFRDSKNYYVVYLMTTVTIPHFIEIIQKNCNKSYSLLDSSAGKSSLNITTNYDEIEPLLLEKTRLSVYPIIHNDIWHLYMKQRKAFWVPEEVLMSNDKTDFNRLDEITQNFIKNILGFFASADGSVITTIMDRFLEDIKVLEIQYGYQYQASMECIHADMYGRLINELISSEEEKIKLFNAVETMPCISEKNTWGRKWAYSNASYAQRLIANAIVEGIFFSGSFCAIYWLKKKNILPGLCQSNELISRDENMHCEFACTIYKNKIVNKLPVEIVYEMVSDAVNIEKKFINESLKCGLIGMNPQLMSQYIEYVADILLQNLDYGILYDAKQPFEFMDNFNLQIKSNFFEVRTTSYKKLADDVLYDGSKDNVSKVEDKDICEDVEESDDF